MLRLSSMTVIGKTSLLKVCSSTISLTLSHCCLLAKNFIKSLLNPNPAQRPTATKALKDPVCRTRAFHLVVF